MRALAASTVTILALAALTALAAAAPADSVQVFDPRGQEQPAYEQDYREAGFGVFWPAGCGEIDQRVSNGPTDRAAREWFYSCNPDGDRRRGASVLRLQGARTPQDGPPHPRFVVDLVKQHLALFSVRIVRQRPLELDAMQGVDVHASEPFGAGEVWVRGLLVGTDVFVLMAWNRAGNVFEDPEIERFIASLRLL